MNLNMVVPPAGNALNQRLQQEYRSILEGLFNGYTLGIPAGAPNINAARDAMLGTGLDAAAVAVADAGFLVAFDKINDPRFTPVDHP
jgi:hypothetical protein